MKRFLLSAAALTLPAGSHAFLAAVKSSPAASTRLFQQYYDEQGGQYYEGGEGQPQQFYDEHGNPIYMQDPTQQQYQQQPQEYYPEQQQQGMDPNAYNQGGEEPSLIISDDMQGEMARATSGIELGGIDYLALARQRAAARVESNNSMSNDADWLNLAEAKKAEMGDMAEYATDDDWEKSLEDEGSMSDSAALGMGVKMEEAEGGMMVTEGGLVVDSMGEGGEDEPQLLL